VEDIVHRTLYLLASAELETRLPTGTSRVSVSIPFAPLISTCGQSYAIQHKHRSL
ncbi:unnamed protein product, partial [Choristocarpus tenellus]